MITGQAKRSGYSDVAVSAERLAEEDRYSLLMGSQMANQEPSGATFQLEETIDLLCGRYGGVIEALNDALPDEESRFILDSLICGLIHGAQARGAELQAWFSALGVDIAAVKVAMVKEMK